LRRALHFGAFRGGKPPGLPKSTGREACRHETGPSGIFKSDLLACGPATGFAHFIEDQEEPFMATVKDVLAVKGSQVLSIGPSASVLLAANLMNEHRVGSVVVLDQGRVAGIFTERDVLRRVVGEQRDPAKTSVAEVMTAEVVCCKRETTIEEIRGAMKNRRIRHLPVIDEGDRLVGLISIGDLNAQLAAIQEQTIHLLQEYVAGRT
jgi:CBS domain-containing protein